MYNCLLASWGQHVIYYLHMDDSMGPENFGIPTRPDFKPGGILPRVEKFGGGGSGQENDKKIEEWSKRVASFTIEDWDKGRKFKKSHESKDWYDIVFGNGKLNDSGKYGNAAEFHTREKSTLLLVPLSAEPVRQEALENHERLAVAVCINYPGEEKGKNGRWGSWTSVFIMRPEEALQFARETVSDPTLPYRLVEKLNDGPLQGIDLLPGERVEILANKLLGGKIDVNTPSKEFPSDFKPGALIEQIQEPQELAWPEEPKPEAEDTKPVKVQSGLPGEGSGQKPPKEPPTTPPPPEAEGPEHEGEDEDKTERDERGFWERLREVAGPVLAGVGAGELLETVVEAARYYPEARSAARVISGLRGRKDKGASKDEMKDAFREVLRERDEEERKRTQEAAGGGGRPPEPPVPPTRETLASEEGPEGGMNWSEADRILKKFVAKKLQGRPTTHKEETKVEDALDERDRMVEKGKSVTRPLKEAVADIYDRVIFEDQESVNSGRPRENPLLEFNKSLDSLRVNRGEPEGELNGLVGTWIDGVRREVELRAIRREIQMRKELGIQSNDLEDKQNQLKTEWNYLNWGDHRAETEARIGGLAESYVNWLESNGPQAEIFNQLRQEKAAMTAAQVEAARRGVGFGGMGAESYAEAQLLSQAMSMGISREEYEMIRNGPQDEVVKWLKRNMNKLDTLNEAQRSQFSNRINFSVNLIGSHRGNEVLEENGGKTMADMVTEMWSDRMVFDQLFNAFDNAGKGDVGFGKVSPELAKFARLEVFKSEGGVERLNRMWGEAFPVMRTMESDMGRLKRFLDAKSEEEKGIVIQEVARDLQMDEDEIRFGIKFWRLIGRHAMFDAWIPKDSNKHTSSIRGSYNTDKKLAQLMAFHVTAEKFHFGNNPYFQRECDVQYRDLVSFMFTDARLGRLGLARNKQLIVRSLAEGDDDALQNFDFKEIPDVLAQWFEAAKGAQETADALRDWCIKPSPETVKAVSQTYNHFFAGEAALLNLEPNDYGLHGEEVEREKTEKLKNRKWLLTENIVLKTYNYYTKYLVPSTMRIKGAEARDFLARSLVLVPTSGLEDRDVQMYIKNEMISEGRRRMANATGTLFRLLGVIVGGGGK